MNFKAREKLSAVIRVYVMDEKAAVVCRDLHISRQTWYRWEKEFREAIGRIWGGLNSKLTIKGE